MALPYNSKLTLYHDIPFDPMYEHSVLFDSPTAQDNYFTGQIIADNVKFKHLSYLRYQRGVIKVQSKMSLLTNCNYLKFYNETTSLTQDYEDVSFYCFITGIEYINENTVAISYEIDHFQTWMFYYRMNPCYVEREHVASDNVGEHRVAEGLDTGEYTVSNVEFLNRWLSNNSANSGYLVVATQKPDGSTFQGYVENTYTGLAVAYARNTYELDVIINNYLSGPTASIEPIICISQFPANFVNEDATGTKGVEVTLQLDQTYGLGGFKNWNPTTETYETYIPQNNKLYGYPYNFMTLESPEGSSCVLKYEDFWTFDEHKFLLALSTFPTVEMSCTPVGYQWALSSQGDIRHVMCSKMSPTVGVTSDAFQAWWAQNKYYNPYIAPYVEGLQAWSGTTSNEGGLLGGLKNTVNAIKNGISAMSDFAKNPSYVAGGISDLLGAYENMRSALTSGKTAAEVYANAGGAVLGGLGKKAGTIAEELMAYESHQVVPNITASKASGGGVLHLTMADCFKVYYTQIRPEYARIIDGYLSAFGYAVHTFKVPERTSRYYWNYVKTVGCTIMPLSNRNNYLPTEAEKAICDIYDNGITIWHDPTQIKIYWHEDPQHNVVMYNPIVQNGVILNSAPSFARQEATNE